MRRFKTQLLAALAASAVWAGVAAAQAPVYTGQPVQRVPAMTVMPTQHMMVLPTQSPIYIMQNGEPIAPPKDAPAAPSCCGISTCCDTCNSCKPPCVHCEKKKKCCDICAKCDIHCFKCWTCEDLEMKPFEPTPNCCGLLGCFFHCPSEDDLKGCNGCEAKKEEKKEEEKKECEEEEEADLTPLMSVLECCDPCKFKCFTDHGFKVYGWTQAGFLGNFDSPDDRVSYGTNFNWRSNDWRANQAPYFVFEKSVAFEDKADFGFRVDMMGGTDAPLIASNGLFDHVTGLDPFSGIGFEGPASFRNVYKYGYDMPQMYVEGYLPLCCGDVLKGIDVKVGKAYTAMGFELIPAPQTDFYTHSYEFFYSVPFTHTGIFNTLKVTDTVDIMICFLRGWDVWEDNNDRITYHGALIWNSCDKRTNWTTAWITGPEQWEGSFDAPNPGANDNYRTVVTSYVNHKFGCYNEWRAAFGGNIGNESNAVLDADGNLQDAEWYGMAGYLFYTVSPKFILGARAEWFRDDDGARTAVYGRPPLDGNFYEVTLGATYKPYQNLRIRPEIRYDWFNGNSTPPGLDPYNDLADDNQFTLGFDVIWEF